MSKTRETPVADQFVETWNELFQNREWSELSDDDLYAIEAILWEMHTDAVQEWSRWQMRKADPAR